MTALAGCGGRTYKWEGETMGTRYHITTAHVRLNSKKLQTLKNEIAVLLRRMDKELFSTYAPESEISRFNRHRSLKPFPVSPETIKLVKAMKRFHEDSGGVLEPTIGPLVDLWGFGPKKMRQEPSEQELETTRKRIGFKRLKWRENPPALIKTNPDLELNLNAVAEGFVIDRIAAMFNQAGMENYLIEIGGEVRAAGNNPQGKPWRIGIDQPEEGSAPGEAFGAVMELKDAALATSGSYRNFRIKEGKRLSHLIDPKTGRPISHWLVSATVMAPTCLEADAAATAAMIMGPAKALNWIQAHPGWEALLWVGSAEGKIRKLATSGFPNSN